MTSGFVGGDPAALDEAGDRLTAAADALESVIAPFMAATGAAIDAAGAPAAYVALARLRSAWGRGLTELSGQVRATGVVATAAGQDLASAEGR